jgi:hypothetical protein
VEFIPVRVWLFKWVIFLKEYREKLLGTHHIIYIQEVPISHVKIHTQLKVSSGLYYLRGVKEVTGLSKLRSWITKQPIKGVSVVFTWEVNQFHLA